MGQNKFWLKCTGIVWFILFLTYSLYTFSFFLGNHDWSYLRYGTGFFDAVWEGHITQFLPLKAFLGGQIFPILNVFLGFGLLSGSAVLLAYWYQIPKKNWVIVAFSCLVVLNPYIASQLYYLYLFLSFSFWQFFCVCGVVLIWQSIDKKKIASLVAGAFLLLVALLGYAPCVELIWVLCIGKFLQEFFMQSVWNREALFRYAKLFFVLLMVFLLYTLVMKILIYSHFVSTEMYNTQVLSLSEIVEGLVTQWKMPFEVLWLDLPYSNRFLHELFFLLLAGVVGVCCQRKKFSGVLVVIALCYASIACAYVSPHPIFHVLRVHSFSIPYFIGILFMIIVKYGSRLLKNVTLLAILVLIVGFVHIDFMVQKVWYLGNRQDEMAIERIKGEILPNLKPNQHYRLSVLGNFYGREKFSHYRYISDVKRENYREYFGFPYFYNVFFSQGLWGHEAFNPIWGDAFYIGSWVYWGANNENIEPKEKKAADEFARTWGNDREQIWFALRHLRTYPQAPYYFVGEKDILLMLGEDEKHREILKQHFMSSY